jgi:6-bladed beta-propeller
MAINSSKSRYSLKSNSLFKNTKHLGTLAILAIMIFASINCQSSYAENSSANIPLKDSAPLLSDWYDIFEQDKIISFSFDKPGEELITLGGLVVTPDGDYIIADGKAKKIFQFSPEGKFKRSIGGHGEGPGEFSIGGRPYLDKDKNLYIYDVLKRRLNKYKYPKFEFEKVIKIATSLQKYIFDDKGNIIIYTVNDPHVLHKIDQDGKIVKKAFQPNQIKLRLFLGRFRLGRVQDVAGKGFLFSYPEEYKIHFYDYQFNKKKTLYPTTDSRFFPGKAKFPNSLSPYAFSPDHSKWWSESLRPSRLFYLGDGMVIQELIKYTKMSEKYYINLHNINGSTHAVGVETPFKNSVIRFAKDGFVYVVENSDFDENGNVVPPKLHRFHLKNRFKKEV